MTMTQCHNEFARCRSCLGLFLGHELPVHQNRRRECRGAGGDQVVIQGATGPQGPAGPAGPDGELSPELAELVAHVLEHLKTCPGAATAVVEAAGSALEAYAGAKDRLVNEALVEKLTSGPYAASIKASSGTISTNYTFTTT